MSLQTYVLFLLLYRLIWHADNERLPKAEGERYKVVVGKDARLSGDMEEQYEQMRAIVNSI